MTPISSIPMLFAITAAMLAAALLPRCADTAGTPRHAALDGLRGYLAFFVFLHHSAYWYAFVRTGEWGSSSSLIVHLGQSSVMLFFMATGFLFWSKLIDNRSRPIDWTRLYISRILRLAPLYWFAMLLMFVAVAHQSHWTRVDSPLELLKGMARWLTFTVLGIGDLNGVEASCIVAGVTWSLKYEWFFYLVLPALAVMVGRRPPAAYLALSLLVGGLCLRTSPSPYHLGGFLGGLLAAHLVRSKSLQSWSAGKPASFVLALCLILTVWSCPTAYAVTPLVLLSAAFALVAGGNDLFGLLTIPAARKLGEISYSIYMLHGLLLHVVVRVWFGVASFAALSVTEHWLVVVSLSPVLIAMCGLTYHAIERPAMNLTPRVTEWIRTRLRMPVHNRLADSNTCSST